MATLVLSTAGAALGSLVPGTFLGLTGAAVGRAIGAQIGYGIDQSRSAGGAVSGAAQNVEVGRVGRFRLGGAGEGQAVATLYGQMRLGGQVIWASQFLETATTATQTLTTGRGKGGRSQPVTQTQTTTSYAYSISLALAICEGEILHLGRIWADGMLLDPRDLEMRVYKGNATQDPDPLIEAIEGAGQVPAYRGIAYVVIEDLALAPFGNRVPQFSFEVTRPPKSAPDGVLLDQAVKAVALIPGTGEYALSTRAISFDLGLGRSRSANVNDPSGQPDFLASLNRLEAELPALRAVSLVVSWFGDDLRAGQCRIMPKVEQKDTEAAQMPWRAGGITRAEAEVIARIEDRSVYGGTPSDGAVIEAIAELRARGLRVLHYPFLLMEILADNDLPDPYGGARQAAFPWRGRITARLAPNQAGSPDKTAEITADMAAFFGAARAQDFQINGQTITYSGPQDWGYRRFILHNAALCAAAGGVEAFSIGSEMRGLMALRDETGFPAVAQMRDLVAEIRQFLPDAKIGYSADWSEYFGHQPQDGTGDVFYHLDPLWADPQVDFVGIDNYMPLADWRDGVDHLDANLTDSTRDIAYLQSNIEGGEGYDWFYASPQDRHAQIRTPITDGLAGKNWVFRYKDIRAWWSNYHVARIDGVEGNALDLRGDVAGAFAGVDVTVENRAGLTPAGRVFARLSLGGLAARLSREVTLDPEQVYRLTALIRAPFGDVAGHLSIDDGGLRGEAYVATADWARVAFDFQPTRAEVVIRLVDLTLGGDAGVLDVAEIGLVPENPNTAWLPQSKPIWMTEYGCPAIDKGANQPNIFGDPKSAEDGLPYFSNGARDDAMQVQFLRAYLGYWGQDGRNPISSVYGGPMIDLDHAHIWAWDTRPFPTFPDRVDIWSDGGNFARGHWFSGRAGLAPLGAVVAEICAQAGVDAVDVTRLDQVLRGHVSSALETPRAQLQPLMQAYGFTAVEREGQIVFLPLPKRVAAMLGPDDLAQDGDGGAFVFQRAGAGEDRGVMRLGFVQAEADYPQSVVETRLPDERQSAVSTTDLPLSLRRPEAEAIAQFWLAQTRIARDGLRFALPPSRRALGVGDVVGIAGRGGQWRIDRLTDRGLLEVEASRTDLTLTLPQAGPDGPAPILPSPPIGPVLPLFLDLPLLTGAESPHAPYLAVAGDPWPQAVAAYRGQDGAGFARAATLARPAAIGRLLDPLARAQSGLWDRGPEVRVELPSGALESLDDLATLNGGNLAAIGSGDGANWEVIQFAQSRLIAPDLFAIGRRLRGQAGSEGIMPDFWPVGSYVVLLDGRAEQIPTPLALRGLLRDYRVGPAARPFDDASFVARSLAFEGVGLRPYAPAHLRTRRLGGDLTLTWIRRTRIDGDTWQGVDVPLGEASEVYLLRILKDGAVLAETTIAPPPFVYGAAQAAADGATAPFDIEIAQISESFGPGLFARITIHD